ncbi:alpha-ketoacid dehydrogenase kinase N-terminal domain-containing protein [Dacryopinax primogenitus]|uniref:Protein-serine/threonine kinase n=1 Tax=Dacryopinax primogenitus (strain DJM 731) TaxID=1858805 RepID=M5G1K9_DACPD|nr:alpha-ketoacid dehydrogenase kinase N-terminal domain-containing protein [Dacryopinax primogenitus]EJU02100.1 alpha-ketoacid dehydrogenase kinase N-terminal domain-containing protein [Dacryopinax primogenitus]
MSLYTITPALWQSITHYATFPQTGVSLQQMILFGEKHSQGTLLQAAQFLSEELPVRLAHRVKELEALPEGLSEMPSIVKVKNWYAQSFEELINFPPPQLTPELRKLLSKPTSPFPSATVNPALSSFSWSPPHAHHSAHPGSHANGTTDPHKRRIPIERRLYSSPPENVTWPPSVIDYNRRFTKTLEVIKRRHDPTATTVAAGVLEWKKRKKWGGVVLHEEIGKWLDRFYLSRIGIRFLIGQHIALNTQPVTPDHVGIICKHANVHSIVSEAIENARFICEEHYGLFKGPVVELICDEELTFPYVPGHLNHICFELLKNSLRATIERHGPSSPPPIKIIVSSGLEDITIKISDEGGGIPRSAVPWIWTYMYTTMENQALDEDFGESDFRAPMAGFGYGLPLSRLYARYFGGDLQLISLEGYGTDVYIHLNKLSSSEEPLM